MQYAGGQVLEEKRRALDLTRRKVADAIGVTEATLYNWENDVHIPGADDLAKLARVLKLALKDFYV
jgi:transcriptional regulator with XRE-family HTH domain